MQLFGGKIKWLKINLGLKIKVAILMVIFIFLGNLLACFFGLTEELSKIFYWPQDSGLVAGEYTVKVAAGGVNSFTLVILPDTQNYTNSSSATANNIFKEQTQWIMNNRTSQKIAYVLHEGDITENWQDEAKWQVDWQNAKSSLNILDGVNGRTDSVDGVPYALAPGNHDGQIYDIRNTVLFNQTFPVSQFATLGGTFESNKIDNAWYTFYAGGKNWLILTLENFPRDTVLNWAGGVVSTHPNYLVMVVTHAYLWKDGSLHDSNVSGHEWTKTNDAYFRYNSDQVAVSNDGVDVWNKLVSKYKNIIFVFCGHIIDDETYGARSRRVDTRADGSKVYSILADYQSVLPYGGNGYLRILDIDPDAGTVNVKTFSPYLNTYLTDAGNQFILTGVDFNLTTTGQTSSGTSGAGLVAIKTGKMLGNSYDAKSFYISYDGGISWQKTYSETIYKPGAQGKLMNMRTANAIFDDENSSTKPVGFNAETNTTEFIDNLPSYKESGVLAVTVGLQGGYPGYENALASAFNTDGTYKDAWFNRLERVIKAAENNKMIVIVSLFYQRQIAVLSDDNAIRNAVTRTANWLKSKNFKNVIIEIANEYNHSGFDGTIVRNGVGGLVQLAKSSFDTSYTVPVAASVKDMSYEVADGQYFDLVLVHGNQTTAVQDKAQIINLLTTVTDKPVVMNEDDSLVGGVAKTVTLTSSNNYWFTTTASAQAYLDEDELSAKNVFDAGSSWGLHWWPYNQYVPSKWTAGTTANVSSAANYFKSLLDYVKSLVLTASTNTSGSTNNSNTSNTSGTGNSGITKNGGATLRFDFSGDNKIDVRDFGILLSYWGQTNAKHNIGPVDGATCQNTDSANLVDELDLVTLLTCWGTPTNSCCYDINSPTITTKDETPNNYLCEPTDLQPALHAEPCANRDGAVVCQQGQLCQHWWTAGDTNFCCETVCFNDILQKSNSDQIPDTFFGEHPSLTSDAQGNIHMIYSGQSSELCANAFFYRKYSVQTQSWSPAYLITGSELPYTPNDYTYLSASLGGRAAPDIELDSLGSIHVVWGMDGYAGTNSQNFLFYSASSDGGLTWSQPENISDDFGPTTNREWRYTQDMRASLDIDKNNTVYVSMRRRFSAGENNEIVTLAKKVNETAFKRYFVITNPAENRNYFYGVMLDGSNNMHFVFRGATESNSSCAHLLCDTTTKTCGQENVMMSYVSNNEDCKEMAAVTWQNNMIYGALLKKGGPGIRIYYSQNGRDWNYGVVDYGGLAGPEDLGSNKIIVGTNGKGYLVIGSGGGGKVDNGATYDDKTYYVEFSVNGNNQIIISPLKTFADNPDHTGNADITISGNKAMGVWLDWKDGFLHYKWLP